MNTKIHRLLIAAALVALVGGAAFAQSPDPGWNVWQRQAYDNLIDWRESAIAYLNDQGGNYRPGDDDVGTYDIALIEEEIGRASCRERV